MKCFKCGDKITRNTTNFKCKEKDTCIGKEMIKNPTQWFSIIVAGVINSGKTYFIINLIRQLLEPNTKAFLQSKGIKVSFYDEDQIAEEKLDEFDRMVKSRYRFDYTEREEKDIPFILKFECEKRGKKKKQCFLTFFNINGEAFESHEKMVQNIAPHIRNANLFIILIDPTRDEGMTGHLMIDSEEQEVDQNKNILKNIHRVVINNPGIRQSRRDTQVTAPSAICISKFDLFDLKKRIPEEISSDIFLTHEDLFIDSCKLNHQSIRKSSKELEDFLDSMNKDENGMIQSKARTQFDMGSLNELYRFSEIFAVAPIGHNDITNYDLLTDAKPKGLMAPFFWLLDKHGVFT